MKLQFYETLQDKSKEYINYLIEQLLPRFTSGEFKLFLEEVSNKPQKPSKGSKGSKSKSKPSDKFVIIGDDKGKSAVFSKLNESQQKLLFQIFISRELNDRMAVKWRFYQYIKYHLGLNIKSIKINMDVDQHINFIIGTEENKYIFVLCYDILELTNFKKGLEEIKTYVKTQNLIPDQIIFATNKSFRTIPIGEPYKIINSEIVPELWIELIQENLLFNKEDLLIINDSELKIAGFNFTSDDDMLNYIYQYSKGGQISIFKQSDFYTEAAEDEPEVDLIWKGIMMK